MLRISARAFFDQVSAIEVLAQCWACLLLSSQIPRNLKIPVHRGKRGETLVTKGQPGPHPDRIAPALLNLGR